MTEQQVLKEIFNTFRWYDGLYTGNYARVLKHRYENTSLSQCTIDLIIKHCGYLVVTEKRYGKCLDIEVII